MRFREFATIKPIKPMTPDQFRIHTKGKQVDAAKRALKAEKDAQRLAKEHEQARKARQPKR